MSVAARNSEFIKNVGFRVWCRYFTPVDIVGHGEAGTIGDYALADHDGTVVVPSDKVEEVVSKVEEVLQTENKVRAAILDSVAPKGCLLKIWQILIIALSSFTSTRRIIS